MIFSNEQLFSDHQAITASAPSTNYIDLGEAGTPILGNRLTQDIGPGEPIPLECLVTEAFNTLTSLTVEVQVDSDVAFGSPKTVASHAFTLAQLVPGANLPFQFIPDGTDERYLRLNYVVTGANPTTGKLFAGVSCGRQTA